MEQKWVDALACSCTNEVTWNDLVAGVLTLIVCDNCLERIGEGRSN